MIQQPLLSLTYQRYVILIVAEWSLCITAIKWKSHSFRVWETEDLWRFVNWNHMLAILAILISFYGLPPLRSGAVVHFHLGNNKSTQYCIADAVCQHVRNCVRNYATLLVMHYINFQCLLTWPFFIVDIVSFPYLWIAPVTECFSRWYSSRGNCLFDSASSLNT